MKVLTPCLWVLQDILGACCMIDPLVVHDDLWCICTVEMAYLEVVWPQLGACMMCMIIPFMVIFTLDMVCDGFTHRRWLTQRLFDLNWVISWYSSLGHWWSSNNLLTFYMLGTHIWLLALRTPYLEGEVFYILEEVIGPVSIQIHSIKIWTCGHDRHATRKGTFLQHHYKASYYFLNPSPDSFLGHI